MHHHNRVLVLSVVVFCGCCMAPSLSVVVPDGFNGTISVVLDVAEGVEVPKRDGGYVYTIPESGVLVLKTLEPFENEHMTHASYRNGERIPLSVEALVGPRGEAPSVGPDAVLFKELGISDNSRQKITMHLFVGTEADLNEWRPPNIEGAINGTPQ